MWDNRMRSFAALQTKLYIFSWTGEILRRRGDLRQRRMFFYSTRDLLSFDTKAFCSSALKDSFEALLSRLFHRLSLGLAVAEWSRFHPPYVL